MHACHVGVQNTIIVPCLYIHVKWASCEYRVYTLCTHVQIIFVLNFKLYFPITIVHNSLNYSGWSRELWWQQLFWEKSRLNTNNGNYGKNNNYGCGLSRHNLLFLTKQGGIWLGMTSGFSTQVRMNVKPISAFKSGLIRQVVFECVIQGPL